MKTENDTKQMIYLRNKEYFMQWSNEIWTAVIVAFFVGAVVGYLILLTTNANAKKQQELEVDLNAAKQKMEEQKQQLEKHFEQSALLLSTLADDYKKLYSHLAQSSQTLLPETSAKLEFFQQQSEPISEEAHSNESLELAHQIPENNSTSSETETPPKDYTEGSSGLLKS